MGEKRRITLETVGVGVLLCVWIRSNQIARPYSMGRAILFGETRGCYGTTEVSVAT